MLIRYLFFEKKWSLIYFFPPLEYMIPLPFTTFLCLFTLWFPLHMNECSTILLLFLMLSIYSFTCNQDYQAMVAQLEHQFRIGRLSVQGLWFYCQVGCLFLLENSTSICIIYNFVIFSLSATLSANDGLTACFGHCGWESFCG